MLRNNSRKDVFADTTDIFFSQHECFYLLFGINVCTSRRVVSSHWHTEVHQLLLLTDAYTVRLRSLDTSTTKTDRVPASVLLSTLDK